MKRILYAILLIINLIFAAALIVSTLAGKVEPSRMVLVSILSYGYMVFLLANMLFAIMWLCLSRWEFLISVAAIVARLSFLPLFFQLGGTSDPQTGEGTLRLMTFNTHAFAGMDDDTMMRPDSGAILLLKLLDEEQPDVLCMQEYYISPRKVKMRDSLRSRGYTYNYGIHGKKGWSQCVLFSRCPIVREYDMDRRSKFYVDVEKDGKVVRICVVHLHSYRLNEDDFESFERLSHAQTDSTTQRFLKKFEKATKQHEKEWKEELLPLIEKSCVPIIVTGDFNDTPASYIYQQARELLNDSYVEQGRGFGTTYHGLYPAFRIDYILHSRDIEALSYKRVQTPISDHYPIVADLKIN